METINAIEQNAARLIQSVNLTLMCPDIFEKPLSWRIGVLALMAGAVNDTKVVDWASRSLAEMRRLGFTEGMTE